MATEKISANNKRIAKNTILLYIRMFVTMCVSFYTSRVILQVLGVDDFGLYNIVGGIVVLFSILNGALSSSTQRFLNYEIGKNHNDNVTIIFKNSLSLHLVLLVIILILSESFGLWYLNHIMNIPIDRQSAANYVYQFSIVTFCLNVIRVPFNASIIAYEKMNFYAYVSIFETVLKLLIVYLLLIGNFDKLILYGFLLMLVTFLVNSIYVIYCCRSFRTIKLGLSWNKNTLSNMMSFSSWSLFGSVAVVSSQQGINLILNYFFGVAINAATGVASQVTNAMYAFISNFQIAFNPQIIKLYAQGNKEELTKLIFRASKFSFLLFWLIGLPMLVTAPTILEIWLDVVPEHAVSFTRVIIIYLLIDALNGPLWTAVNATGKIKYYQILMSCILLLNLPVAYIMLWYGYIPETVWFSRIVFNIFAMVVRLIYLNKIMDFPVTVYISKIIFPLGIIVICSLLISFFLIKYNNLTILTIIIDVFAVMILSFFIILTSSEKIKILMFFKKKIKSIQ